MNVINGCGTSLASTHATSASAVTPKARPGRDGCCQFSASVSTRARICAPPSRTNEIGQSLAIPRDEGVEVHQLGQPLGGALGDPGDDHAAVAMADEHDVGQVLVLQHAEHVLDVGVEVHPRVGQMRPLPEPGKGRRIHGMAGSAAAAGLPAASTSPRATHRARAGRWLAGGPPDAGRRRWPARSSLAQARRLAPRSSRPGSYACPCRPPHTSRSVAAARHDWSAVSPADRLGKRHGHATGDSSTPR